MSESYGERFDRRLDEVSSLVRRDFPALVALAEQVPSRAPVRVFTCPRGHAAPPVQLSVGMDGELYLDVVPGAPPSVVQLVNGTTDIRRAKHGRDVVCIERGCRNKVSGDGRGKRCRRHRSSEPPTIYTGRTRFVCGACRDMGDPWAATLTLPRLLELYVHAVRAGQQVVSVETGRASRRTG